MLLILKHQRSCKEESISRFKSINLLLSHDQEAGTIERTSKFGSKFMNKKGSSRLCTMQQTTTII